MRAAEYLDRAASITPQETGFIDHTGPMTFHDAMVLTHRIASALLCEPQIPQGAKVAIYSPNNTIAYLAALGINRCDYIWTPLNYRNSLETNIELMQFLDVDVLIFHSDFEDQVETIKNAVPNIGFFICLNAPSAHGLELTDFIADHNELITRPPEDPDQTIMIIATGGTTGPSKGVEHTHRTYEACITNMNSSLSPSKNLRHLIVAPLTHSTGFIASCHIAAGGCNIIHSGFDATAVLKTIEEEKITNIFLPPTAFYALLEHPDVKTRNVSSLTALILGSAPCSPEKFRRGVEVFGPCMTEAFGQMETLFPMLLKTAKDYLKPDGSIDEAVMRSTGRPGLASWIEIMDDDGNILPAGEKGEMVVRSSSVMKSYYKNPEATAEVSTHNWHHTGDVAVKDANGYVTIVDRIKDMIISGGFNVYPVEVEAVLNSLPYIENCAVIGVPDEKWGEAVKAVVQLTPNTTTSEEEIIAFCKEKLGSVKSPKTVDFWETLPLSPVGKVLKRDIRQSFWSENSRAI